MKSLPVHVALFVGSVVQPIEANAQSQQESLFQRIAAGTKCEQVPSNGLYCKYELSSVVSVSIKDVGGAETVIGFLNSNIKNEFYAVMYFGCVVIVPGNAYMKNYDRNLEIFISPKTGGLYRVPKECQDSLK
jgi:hypothetical protein